MKRVIAWMLTCVILLSTAPLEAIAAAPEEEPSTSAAQETTDLQETAGTIVQITDGERSDGESIPTSLIEVEPQPSTENAEAVEKSVEQDTQTQAEELVSLQSTTTELPAQYSTVLTVR